MNDASLKNISAWVSKKVPELVGMEEPDLVEFIMANVRKQASAGEWCERHVGGDLLPCRCCTLADVMACIVCPLMNWGLRVIGVGFALLSHCTLGCLDDQICVRYCCMLQMPKLGTWKGSL